MTSRRHTVLHELRADHGRGWVAWLHLDPKGRVAKLYLQKGRQAWRVDRSVPLFTDAAGNSRSASTVSVHGLKTHHVSQAIRDMMYHD